MTTDQQQIITFTNMSLPSSSKPSASSSKPPPTLNLDEPGITRLELLAAFPTILEVVTDHPPSEHSEHFVRCLICKSTLSARNPHFIVKHLKGPEHQKKQKASEIGISRKLYAVISKYPPGAFRLLDNTDTIQCNGCLTNLGGAKLGQAVKVHLKSEFHIRSMAIKSQRDALNHMSKQDFDRFFVQTMFVDCEMSVVKMEKNRVAIEALVGRSVPSISVTRKMINDMKAAKDEEEEGKSEWKRISLPEPDPEVSQLLEETKKKLKDGNEKKRKLEGKGEGKVGGKKKKKKDEEINFEEAEFVEVEEVEEVEDQKAISNIEFY